MFSGGGNYYYLIIGLQALCVINSMRQGTLNKWIWLIIFLPVIGCLVYIYMEILSRRSFRAPQINVGGIINPGGKIKKLEEALRFSDTFNNKIRLADAYLEAGFTERAIELYEGSLTGAFAENEHVMAQLIVAYFEQERYEEIIPIAKKLYRLPQFPRSKAHLTYAMALEKLGNIADAENEFKAMKGRYSYFEARYQYGLFLARNEREEDAAHIFTEMLTEQPHLSSIEQRSNRQWFSKAKDELKKLQALNYAK